MGSLKKADCLLVGFSSPNGDVETSLVVVGTGERPTTVVNAFSGKEAVELYKKLLGEKESMYEAEQAN